ncbi:hypothetical protein COCNU_14G004910 [Cocos nucifera]|uniref:Uncharacterized protein n=1 Tax=Cocos nucifera TaxID=13894 RepID=A0A8K0NC92_COCNU|nr:hypothetical protein COCNU_14G004910 [Cocos nucifera]
MVASGGKHRWGGAAKQITKSNFSAALQQIKAHIQDADFIAISSQKTGDLSASSHRCPWRRVLPIDIPETAYLKAKLAAETFELLPVTLIHYLDLLLGFGRICHAKGYLSFVQL